MPIHLQFEGGYNFRDLGEIQTRDGKMTKRGVFIRCGNLDRLSEAAQEQLIQYGVKTVIDLRTVWECENYPNVFAKSQHLQYKNLPLILDKLGDEPEFRKKSDNLEHLHEVYRLYIDHCQAEIGAIFIAIAESDGATVFHCYAGKDRTGVIAAMLLALVGVDDEAIAADYAETNAQIAHLVTQWFEDAARENRDMRKLKRNSGAEPETILDTLAYIRETYGGVAEYLQGCGVSLAQLEQIRARFV